MTTVTAAASRSNAPAPIMNTVVQVALVLAALVLASESRRLSAEDGGVGAVLAAEALPEELPLPPPSPEETAADDDAQDMVAPPPPRRRRSTTVFRPLFATRERDAERQKQAERRREYWAKENRRQAAVGHAYAPAYAPAGPVYRRPAPAYYHAAYAGYPVGYAAGR